MLTYQAAVKDRRSQLQIHFFPDKIIPGIIQICIAATDRQVTIFRQTPCQHAVNGDADRIQIGTEADIVGIVFLFR